MNKLDIVKALLCESQSETTDGDYPFKVGDKVFIKTVTLYYLGRIKSIQGGFITLEDASWVQDTGSRLCDFLQKGINREKSEIEPIGIEHITMANIIGISEWKHDLPKEQV